MDICNFCYIIIHCVIIIQGSSAKTFSLNEAIAAETQQKELAKTTSTPKIKETTTERFSLNKILTSNPLLAKKYKETENFLLRSKKTSPLKYRRAFQIKTPLKPKKLKRSPKQKYKGRSQSIKSETNGSEKFNHKYIPLLKSIGILFDNLLDTDADNPFEIVSHKRKRHRNKSISTEDSRVVCKCAEKSDVGKSNSESTEKTIVIPNARITSSVSTEEVTVQVTTPATNNSPFSDISSLRQHKNVPLLLPGNPVSSRRNNYGISERSSTAHHRSSERYFSRDYGTSEHNTGCRENESNTSCYEEITLSPPRDGTSSNGTHGGKFRIEKEISRTVLKSTTAEIIDFSEDEDATEGLATKFKREDNLEIRGNERKGTKLLPKPVHRLRGHLPEIKEKCNTDSQQLKEIYAESILHVTNNNTRHKRILNRSSPITTENKKTRSGNEDVISNDNVQNPSTKIIGSITSKVPAVMIIDGYSVTRNKHGENKRAKESIHFHL